MTCAPMGRLLVLNAQSLTGEDWRRINIDGVEQTALEERVGAGEDLLSVTRLQRDTEDLKDISGLHLLGETVNVGVDRGVVGNYPMANPLEGLAHGTVHFHGRSFDATLVSEVLGDLLVGGGLSDEAFGLAVGEVRRASRADNRDVNVGKDAARGEARY